jgi:vacuolar protein sorting-associated protein 3
LDIVLNELQNSPESRATLSQTYETYRALQPPKPTYRQFITENAANTEWWHSRLRLLHLLGSSQGPASSYDVLKILNRLEPFVNELVPEMIILSGRQGRHEEALRLLTHGLGDFDTAISYCLLGGSSIFRPPSGFVPEDQLPSKEEQAVLFNYLLHQFLAIEDVEHRIERTSELLERFGPWFDAAYVLSLLPNGWSINIFSTFLINALQRLVRDKKETVMIKALSGAQNLQVSEQFIEKALEIGPILSEDKVVS